MVAWFRGCRAPRACPWAAFVAAGASVVLATHEPVQDTVAAEFSRVLYAHIAQGEPLDIAYRSAVLQLRAKNMQQYDAFQFLVR